jgi:general stress protein YciG
LVQDLRRQISFILKTNIMTRNKGNQDRENGSDQKRSQQDQSGWQEDSKSAADEQNRQEVSAKEDTNNEWLTDRENHQDSPAGERQKSSGRGFASMDPSAQREIASKGGKAAHRQGVAHEWTSEQAREAGRKGGQASSGRGSRQ